MATDLEKKFKKAAWMIRNGPPRPDTSNDEKLKYYSYYKQATEGDVQGAQPWAVQLEARAKWDAWAALKGMSKEEAMQKYIDLITQGENDDAQNELAHAGMCRTQFKTNADRR
jgi:diazepam-binding inhibitor (GABA receptor modulator, acyl-CoA-binding protein)